MMSDRWEAERQEVRQLVQDFLRYNGRHGCEFNCWIEDFCIYVRIDEEHDFRIDAGRYRMMKSTDDRRMYVWKLVCDADMIEAYDKQVLDRIDAGNAEYEDIMTIQDMSNAKR